MKKYFFLAVQLVGFVSCKSHFVTPGNYTNDTATVLAIAIKSALEKNDLPGANELARALPKDSILFTTDILPLKQLPPYVDTFRFKVLSKNDICSQMSDSNVPPPRHYLYLKELRKNALGYDVYLESLTCGESDGGIIALFIHHKKDSFYIKEKVVALINQ